MKKYLLLPFIILALGCSKDDSNNSSSCKKPTNLEASNITNTTASIYWNTNQNTSLFEVEYGVIGFSQGSGTSVSIPNNYIELENLNPETQYAFYVRLFCNEANDYSSWAGPYTFVTLDTNPYCDDPTNLQVGLYDDSVTHNKIDITWENNYGSGAQVQFGLQGFNLGSGTVISLNDSYVTYASITNLNASTTYDFYVRNTCEGTGYSAWVGPLTTTTKPTPYNLNCLDPLNFTLDQIYTTTNGSDVLVFSWDGQNGETTWQLHQVVSGYPFNSGSTLDTSYNPIQLTNYTNSGTVYSFYVRANCGIDGYSDWVGPIEVTGP